MPEFPPEPTIVEWRLSGDSVLDPQHDELGNGEYRLEADSIQSEFGVPEGYHPLISGILVSPGTLAANRLLSFIWDLVAIESIEDGGNLTNLPKQGSPRNRFACEMQSGVMFQIGLQFALKQRLVMQHGLQAGEYAYVNFGIHWLPGDLIWDIKMRERADKQIVDPQRSAGEAFFRPRDWSLVR